MGFRGCDLESKGVVLKAREWDPESLGWDLESREYDLKSRE